jgi:hypothetical protein
MQLHRLATFAMAAAFNLSSSSHADQVHAVGIGTTPCVGFNIAIQHVKDTTGIKDLYFAWAQGFMSALNARAPPGINVQLVPDAFPSRRQ